MKRLFALVACALSCLSAHATVGYVSYDVHVSPTFGTGAPSAALWADLPLFDTSTFVGARLFEVTVEVTSTIEVTGSVTNAGHNPPPGTPVVIPVTAGETILWLFKHPNASLTSGVSSLTQTDGVTETFALKSAAEGTDSQSFDLFDTETSSKTWLDSDPNFDAFKTQGFSSIQFADHFLTACETGQTSFRGAVNVQFHNPQCSARVTYSYVPEPDGVSLAAAALLAGGWVRRRRSA
jgi:hypothetical protein